MALRRFGYVVLALAATVACSSDTPPCRAAAGSEDRHSGNAGCLIRKDRRLLVVRHRLGGKLGFPAGRGKAGESARCTAHRETWEESGVDVEVGRLLGVFRVDGPFYLYACTPGSRLASNQELPVPAWARVEITAIEWVSPKDLEADAWRFPEQFPRVQRLFAELEAQPAP